MVVGSLVRSHMPQANSGPTALPEDRAGVLFLAVDIAQARGEYARAADLQRQLRKLGWVVARRRYRPDLHRQEVSVR
jgi:hypothetical protein